MGWMDGRDLNETELSDMYVDGKIERPGAGRW